MLGPALLSRLYFRCVLQQRFEAATRLARLIGWLHPADGWREQPELLHALHLAHQGDFTAAVQILERFQRAPSLTGLLAVTYLYRMTGQWEELLACLSARVREVERHPQLLAVLLRAYGETGDRRGMVELYRQHQQRIPRFVPAASRDFCRLALFAFCGQRSLIERLFAGSLAVVPAPTQEFWLAIADLAAGDTLAGRHRLEDLLPAAEPPLQRAIERRLSRPAVPTQPLDPVEANVVTEAARDQGHDESFGAQRSLFSRKALATQILIGLNLVMFAAESRLGGVSNPESLYRLGAMFAPAVRAGQWWRLGASLFLHWGWAHLVMNMFALWVLGPFVEFALGFRRFLVVYGLAGLGSMAVVLAFARGPKSEELVVGASGCIMGLIGATGALMLRGWLRDRALIARRRLGAIVLVIGMQTVFDALVPQVSMTAHLSGVVIGFAVCLLLRHRLGAAPVTALVPR